MKDKELQEFYSNLNQSRDDPKKVVTFYDGMASKYDDIMHKSGNTSNVDHCTSLLKESLIEYEVEGREVLDVGCGTGRTGISLKNAGFTEVDGVDPSMASLELAKGTGSYREVFYGMITDTEKLVCKDGSYDGVFCVGCITVGHIVLRNGLAEFIRILKKGGIAVYLISNTLENGKAMQDHVPFVSNGEIEILRLEKSFYHTLDGTKAYCNIYVVRKL